MLLFVLETNAKYSWLELFLVYILASVNLGLSIYKNWWYLSKNKDLKSVPYDLIVYHSGSANIGVFKSQKALKQFYR